jgi:hypothetical protein
MGAPTEHKCACALKVNLTDTADSVLVDRTIHGLHSCQATRDVGPNVKQVPCAKEKCDRSYPVLDKAMTPCRCLVPGGWWVNPNGMFWCPDHRSDSLTYREWTREQNEKPVLELPDHEKFAGGGIREPQGDRPRFELLWPKGVPFEEQILTRFARHMARGAIKYTQYGECTCGASTSTSRSTRWTSAGPAMRRSSGDETLSTPTGSELTPNSGSLTPKTTTARSEWIESESENRTHRGTPTGSPQRSTSGTSNSPAGSVEQNLDTSIMTTGAANEAVGVPSASEERYVTGAISASDTTKVGSRNTRPQHSPGCPALQVLRPGERNWEQFSDEAALEHAQSSLLRHVFQWLAGAEDEDHAAAILFNVMCAEHVRAKLTSDPTEEKLAMACEWNTKLRYQVRRNSVPGMDTPKWLVVDIASNDKVVTGSSDRSVAHRQADEWNEKFSDLPTDS